MIRRASWLTRWASDAPVRVGISTASWSIAGSFARGLLPRTPVQQAAASGINAAVHYQLGATAWALLQAAASRPGERPGTRANLVASGAGLLAGVGASSLAGRRATTSLPASAVSAAGRLTAYAALAGGVAAVWDEALHRRLGLRPGLDTTLVPSIATAGGVVAFTLVARRARLAEYGDTAPHRRAIAGLTPKSTATALGVGAAAALGFAALTTGEDLAARGVERGIAAIIRREPGALGTLVAHGLILGTLAAAGVAGLAEITSRIQRRDDIVEPAYPDPPTSPFVSAGPRSSMPFTSLGKEGRRFVLMALTADAITAVMDEPAIEPVRIVGGFESATEVAERARLTVQDMVDCGAFERGLICIGVPTGVGYFNYSTAEALEYLTRGDCATIVPQYALVPSALALTATKDAEVLTRLVLEGIRERLATVPVEERPRVVLIGESLGANIALDIPTLDDGRAHLSELGDLGVSGGMYLGVPFRTRLWNQWRAEPSAVDPQELLALAADPDDVDDLLPGQQRHLMVVHHDDPVNKYAYSMVVQPPWWMGPPDTRPPLVPREAKFRPITTFLLATVDLFNGMQSKPGTFVRRGHDYRIDLRSGLQKAFGLPATPVQIEAIETALREREQEWATRRMVARKLDRARRSIERQLAEWGQPLDLDLTTSNALGSLPAFDSAR
jgi:uncharacterized membrane protein